MIPSRGARGCAQSAVTIQVAKAHPLRIKRVSAEAAGAGAVTFDTIMFNEVLEDLKDRYPARLTLFHLLSRQPQETALLDGRIAIVAR